MTDAPQIAIRADSSTEIGSGHVVRCLALADALRARGASVQFIARALPGDLTDLIAGEGFSVKRLTGAADEIADAHQTNAVLGPGAHLLGVVVDHYGLGAPWERATSPNATWTLAIDDLTERTHAVDILLNQNLIDPPATAAAQFGTRHLLAGPAYALLRRQFVVARATLDRRGDDIRRVLVFYGGSDPTNHTGATLRALLGLPRRDFEIDVVVGAANPHRQAIAALCATGARAHFHCQVDDMAAVMVRADLAFGAAGSASWERCCVGLPSAVTVLAPNQEIVADALIAAGAALRIGVEESADIGVVARVLADLTPTRRATMRAAGLALVDGRGAERVADFLLKFRRD